MLIFVLFSPLADGLNQRPITNPTLAKNFAIMHLQNILLALVLPIVPGLCSPAEGAKSLASQYLPVFYT
jgi:hypothetical protein